MVHYRPLFLNDCLFKTFQKKNLSFFNVMLESNTISIESLPLPEMEVFAALITVQTTGGDFSKSYFYLVFAVCNQWTTVSFDFHQMAVHKRTTMLAHCNLKQNMCLCSKQSSLFSFYALPSGGKSKDAVVHWLVFQIFSFPDELLWLAFQLKVRDSLTTFLHWN